METANSRQETGGETEGDTGEKNEDRSVTGAERQKMGDGSCQVGKTIF